VRNKLIHHQTQKRLTAGRFNSSQGERSKDSKKSERVQRE